MLQEVLARWGLRLESELQTRMNQGPRGSLFLREVPHLLLLRDFLEAF